MNKYITGKLNSDVNTAKKNETVEVVDERIMEIIKIISEDERILKWVYDFTIGFRR